MIQKDKRQRNKNWNNNQILKDEDQRIESNEMYRNYPDQDFNLQKLLEIDLANRESRMSLEKLLDKDEDQDHSENERGIREDNQKNKEKQEISIIQADQVLSEKAISKEIPDQKSKGQNAAVNFIRTSTKNENNLDQKGPKKQKGLIRRICSANKLFRSRSQKS